jgi:hypothetical protein
MKRVHFYMAPFNLGYYSRPGGFPSLPPFLHQQRWLVEQATPMVNLSSHVLQDEQANC